jgi:hypothetical protein
MEGTFQSLIRGHLNPLFCGHLIPFLTLYAIDVLCDPPLQPFYASLGLRPATGAMRRNYEHQAGAAVGSDGNA